MKLHTYSYNCSYEYIYTNYYRISTIVSIIFVDEERTVSVNLDPPSFGKLVDHSIEKDIHNCGNL